MSKPAVCCVASSVAPFLLHAKLRRRLCLGIRFPIHDEAVLLLGATSNPQRASAVNWRQTHYHAWTRRQNSAVRTPQSSGTRPSGLKASCNGYGQLFQIYLRYRGWVVVFRQTLSTDTAMPKLWLVPDDISWNHPPPLTPIDGSKNWK